MIPRKLSRARRAFLAAAGVVLAQIVLAAAVRADGVLSLPQWTEDEFVLPPLGGGLWPDDFNPADVVHPALATDPAAEEAARAQAENDAWLRFIPRSLFSGRRSDRPEEPPLVEISREALHAAENAPSSSLLLDPQGLLPETQTEDLSRLLAFHAENAGVGASFLMLDARQKLPPDADLSRLASGSLTRGAICLAVYPLGAPTRARLFLSQRVTQSVDAAYLQAMAGACIREAAEIPDPIEQLQRFATQLSIRLFWLERAFPAVKPEPVAVDEPVAETGPQPLSEVAATEPAVAVTVAAPVASALETFWRQWGWQLAGGGAFVVALAVAGILLLRWRARRLRRTVWLLPDYDLRHAPRFGGAHCGACGASVNYG